MNRADQTERQRLFYGSRRHAHLQSRENDVYARKLAREVARAVELNPPQRVLELGAGFGRFTFPLLDFCGSVVASDLSQRVLDTLARTREERGIAEDRCRTLCCDADELTIERAGGPFDLVAGFFFLHHLTDFAGTIRRIAPLLAPGGRMAFVEPNRRNPLFLAQVLFCPDMSWREEKGMFLLTQQKVEEAFRHADLVPGETRTFGFFPPQVLNHLPFARRLEEGLESVRLLRRVLPFLLLNASRAAQT